jgi:acetyl esterase/lipase
MAKPLRHRLSLLALALALAAPGIACAKPKADKGPKSDGNYYLGYHAPVAGAPVRGGVVVTLHGGGWKGDLGSGADDVMRAYIDDLRGWGFPVYNVGYQSDRESLADTLDAVRRVSRRNRGRGLCVLGGSAGAHLALIAAAELPKKVDCVIDIGGPPNLIDPDTQPLSAAVPDVAAAAFGLQNLRELSPIKRVKDIRAPVLVVAPDCDHFTSLRRQQRFAGKLRRGKLVVEHEASAPPPPRNWLQALLAGIIRKPAGVETGHCRVTTESFEAFRQAELRFLTKRLR